MFFLNILNCKPTIVFKLQHNVFLQLKILTFVIKNHFISKKLDQIKILYDLSRFEKTIFGGYERTTLKKLQRRGGIVKLFVGPFISKPNKYNSS